MYDFLISKHSILMLHEVLYRRSSIEFVSDFVERVKILDKNLTSTELMNRVGDYLTFLLSNDFIYIKSGDNTYNSGNIEAFLKILKSSWEEFKNKDSTEYDRYRYTYMIEYTKEWNATLNGLKV